MNQSFIRFLYFLCAAVAFSCPVEAKIVYVTYTQWTEGGGSGLWYDVWYCTECDSFALSQGGPSWFDTTELPDGNICRHFYELSRALRRSLSPGGFYALTADPVNVINGSLVESATDLTLANLAFQRNYCSSRTNATSRIGLGWSDALQWRLAFPEEGTFIYQVYKPDGSAIRFLWAPSHKQAGALAEEPWTILDTNGLFRVITSPGNWMDFNSNGVWTASRTRDGIETVLSYNENGTLVSVTNNVGEKLFFSNNSEGRIVRINTHRPSYFVTYDYDASGRLTTAAVHASGKTFSTGYSYDQNGNCTGTSAPDGLISSRTFDETGRIISMMPGDGFHAHTLSYPTNRWVVSGYNDEDPPFDYHDTSHWEQRDHTLVTYRKNATETVWYDYYPDENKHRIEWVEGPGDSNLRTYYLQNNDNRPTAENFFYLGEPQEMETLHWSYGSRMNCIKESYAFNGGTSVETFTEWNTEQTLPTAVIDAAGWRTEYEWDEEGRILEERTFPDDSSTNRLHYAYTQDGLLSSITDGDGRITRFFHDSAHNVTSVVDAAGVTFDYTWNDLGHLVSSRRRGSPAVFRTTDDRGLVLRIDYPDNRAETFSYDETGRLLSQTDRFGAVTTLRPARYGVPETVTFGGATIETDYDGLNHVVSIRDPLGRALQSYGWDARGRIIAVTNLEGQTASIMYGVRNRPALIRRFDASTLAITNDTRGRVSSVTFPDDTLFLSYLNNDTLTTMTDSSGTIRFRHDNCGSVTNCVTPGGSVDYRISAAGLVTNLSFEAFSIATGYDAAGRPSSLRISGQNLSAPLQFSFSRHPGTELISGITHPNGISAAFSYDAMDRLVLQSWSTGDFLSYAFSNDLVSAITRADGTALRYTYDSFGQLETEANEACDHAATYSFNLAGNRLSKMVSGMGTAAVSYNYGPGNRLSGWSALLTSNSVSFPVAGTSSEPIGTDSRYGSLSVSVDGQSGTPCFSGNVFWTPPKSFPLDEPTSVVANIRDAAGNTTITTNCIHAIAITNALYESTAAGCISSILYKGTSDYERNLAIIWDSRARATNFSTNGTDILTITYDAMGRIITLTDSSGTVQRLHDGVMPLADYHADGTIQRFYIAAPGIDNWLGFIDFAGTETPQLYTFLTDAQGSVFAVADSSGSVIERYEYDAWGRVLSVLGPHGEPLTRSAIGNRILWHGREYFWDIHLYHFRARWYDPVSGRFLSKDPAGISAGLNLYTFCENNPVNLRDPTGYWCIVDDFVFTAGGALVGVGSQIVVDLFRGEIGTLGEYVGAAVGGALSGELLLYSVNPILVGASAGLIGNAIAQRIDSARGVRDFDTVELGINTAVGAVVPRIKVHPKIPGINRGRGNMNWLYKKQVTEMRKVVGSSQTHTVKIKTANKMFMGAAYQSEMEVPFFITAAIVGLYNNWTTK